MLEHLSSDRCRFCRIDAGAEAPFFDRPVTARGSYSVVPSLGSIVAGWTLIVPKEHMLNLSTRYESRELVDLRTWLARHLAAEYSAPVRMFEHGATGTGSLTGCGVDHAHLHLVPYIRSLRRSLEQEPGQWVATPSSGIRAHVGQREYLFYSDDTMSEDPAGLLRVVDQPASQFFRRILAADAGKPTQYDYRTHAFAENIRDTQARLAARFGTNQARPAV